MDSKFHIISEIWLLFIDRKKRKILRQMEHSKVGQTVFLKQQVNTNDFCQGFNIGTKSNNNNLLFTEIDVVKQA